MRVDDVRDKMMNHWLGLGNFGSRLRLIVGSIRYLVQQNVKRRIMLVTTIINTAFVTHSLLLLLFVIDLHYILCNIIQIFMTSMTVMNLCNIKKVNMNIKCVYS